MPERRLRGLRALVTAAAAGALSLIGFTAPADAAGTGASDTWNPPRNLVQPLNEVWNHVESTYPDLYGFRNYGWDQVMANRGSVNYCVRWESDAPVSAALRDRIHAALKKQFGKWMAAMVENGKGHNAWPYTTVPVNIVGWAVKNRSTLQWTDNSVDIYVNDLDASGAPQCAPDCGRFFHQDGNYSQCPGGAARHYDQSLWLTKGFGGGAGGDWGQRIGQRVLHRRAEPGEHPHLPARGRPHLRPRRLLRLDPDRPVLLPHEGGQRRADHRVRQVDVPRLLAPPEEPLRPLTVTDRRGHLNSRVFPSELRRPYCSNRFLPGRCRAWAGSGRGISMARSPGSTGPTLAVVAREAGVSVPTASKVVNGREDVAPETRRRVTEALDRLGYVRRPRFDAAKAARAGRPGRALAGQLLVGRGAARRGGGGARRGPGGGGVGRADPRPAAGGRSGAGWTSWRPGPFRGAVQSGGADALAVRLAGCSTASRSC